jgi:hypothetical protein
MAVLLGCLLPAGCGSDGANVARTENTQAAPKSREPERAAQEGTTGESQMDDMKRSLAGMSTEELLLSLRISELFGPVADTPFTSVSFATNIAEQTAAVEENRLIVAELERRKDVLVKYRTRSEAVFTGPSGINLTVGEVCRMLLGEYDNEAGERVRVKF